MTSTETELAQEVAQAIRDLLSHGRLHYWLKCIDVAERVARCS